MVPQFLIDKECWNQAVSSIRGERQKLELQRLLKGVMAVANPKHLPGIMKRNVNLLLSMQFYKGVVLLQESKEEVLGLGDDYLSWHVEADVDYIIKFVEESNALQINKNNRGIGTVTIPVEPMNLTWMI